ITDNVSSLQKEREELDRLHKRAQAYRTESARLRAEITKLRVSQAQNRTETTAAAGSYREAQQRLTALGKEIRNTAGGFKSMTPELQAKIRQYRELNSQLQKFDKSMGLNYRNIGNYSSIWKSLGNQLVGIIGVYASLYTVVEGVGSVITSNIKVSDTLSDVRRTAELTT